MQYKRVVDEALRDLSLAHTAEEGLQEWIESIWRADQRPLAADVWVFSPDFRRILVVEHRWRGLVPPGGEVEAGEAPREAAIRELAEETGLRPVIAGRPAHAALRSYHRDLPETLNVSYWATADPDAELVPEPGQPALWVEVDSPWRTYHADDAAVISHFAASRFDARRFDGSGPTRRPVASNGQGTVEVADGCGLPPLAPP